MNREKGKGCRSRRVVVPGVGQRQDEVGMWIHRGLFSPGRREGTVGTLDERERGLEGQTR